jgi:hypothetical protein
MLYTHLLLLSRPWSSVHRTTDINVRLCRVSIKHHILVNRKGRTQGAKWGTNKRCKDSCINKYILRLKRKYIAYITRSCHDATCIWKSLKWYKVEATSMGRLKWPPCKGEHSHYWPKTKVILVDSMLIDCIYIRKQTAVQTFWKGVETEFGDVHWTQVRIEGWASPAAARCANRNKSEIWCLLNCEIKDNPN